VGTWVNHKQKTLEGKKDIFGGTGWEEKSPTAWGLAQPHVAGREAVWEKGKE